MGIGILGNGGFAVTGKDCTAERYPAAMLREFMPDDKS
jgi:hypothetical protein